MIIFIVKKKPVEEKLGSSEEVKPFVNNDTKSEAEVTETLFGVNLSVERGKLIGICGSIGSGKSSLMSAICGDVSSKLEHITFRSL